MVQEETKNNSQSSFPRESAIHILTKKIPIVLQGLNIGAIESLLLKDIQKLENINYIYVVDEKGILKGVLSIKELFRIGKNMPIFRVMKTNLITVSPNTHREKVALLAIQHNLKNIPVVDKSGLFLGVVPSDVILNVLHQEGIEDALRGSGILKHDSAKDFITASASEHFKKRLPWLVFGLLGSFLAAIVIGFFEDTLSKMIILASFIPSVVYIADAVGSQTQTIFIRSFFIDKKMALKSYIRREISVGLLLALSLSIAATLLTYFLWNELLITLIIGISFFLTILISTCFGLLLPWIFYKLKFDPAISSGPFSTVISDVLSVLIYLGVAFIALSIF
ncbi:MAG: magnesium transporter [Patescibacteria group bacterium]